MKILAGSLISLAQTPEARQSAGEGGCLEKHFLSLTLSVMEWTFFMKGVFSASPRQQFPYGLNRHFRLNKQSKKKMKSKELKGPLPREISYFVCPLGPLVFLMLHEKV